MKSAGGVEVADLLLQDHVIVPRRRRVEGSPPVANVAMHAQRRRICQSRNPTTPSVIYHRGDSPSLRFGTLYSPKEGDFESVGREIFEIVANESTKVPAVVCNTPVRSATLPAPR